LPLYRYATLVTLPSRIEGLSQALLEAMALGAPVLASRAGGNPELIRPDHTGWLAPPTDPMAWAATIERALADQAARQRVAANARREIRAEFTLPRTAERTEAVYLQALAERRGGARPRASHQDAGPQHHARG
jgi:glycosyltransferase involved in cell wall biosynthesis